VEKKQKIFWELLFFRRGKVRRKVSEKAIYSMERIRRRHS